MPVGLLTVVLAMANFMQVLDLTIANVSLPAITSDLGAVPSQGAWIVTSFAAANAVSVPLTGWLADRYGQVRVFATATLMFTLASLLCGLAWSLPVLIACRVLQGLAAGFMVPLSQSLLLRINPPEKHGMALAIWMMTSTIGPICGPVLGGWITDNLHWSWIFLINLPVGLLAALAIWMLLRDSESETVSRPLDRVGMLLLVVWVAALQVLLDKGNELDWFHSGFIVGLAIVAALGALLFLVWELTDDHPVIDLTLFRTPNFGVGTIVLGLMFGCYQAINVAMPLWLQTQLGYTAQWAGFVLAPAGIMSLLCAPLVGRLMNHFDPRLLSTTGFVLFAISMGLRAGFSTDVDFGAMVLAQLVQGAAGPLFFAPLVTTALGGIPGNRMAAATGTQNFIRIMGGSFGTSVAVAFWSQREAFHRSHLVEGLTATSRQVSDYLERLLTTGISPQLAWARIERLVDQQASTLAVNDLYLFVALLMVVNIAGMWMLRPKRGPGAARALAVD